MPPRVPRGDDLRPTFLVAPRRARVVAAKVSASILIGAGFGFVAGAAAAAVGTAALRARGIDVKLDQGDYVLLVTGSAVAAGCGGRSASASARSFATRYPR